MTYYGGKELAASFRTVRSNTIQAAEDIPEAKYSFKAAPDCRSIGQTLVHVALGPGIQRHIHGNRVADIQKVNFMELFQKMTAEEAKPRSKAEIVAFLKAEGDAFASYLEGLPEAFLGEPVTQMPGAQPASKTRFEMLLSAKEHEMHHRGQLMVLQRMVGLVPHLTRQMQERMAQRAAAAQPAR
ncbi:MAG: DinB family protein [Acidobacteria bacterium]|nr:DinB family protein [Acidobacteriota bacterium]